MKPRQALVTLALLALAGCSSSGASSLTPQAAPQAVSPAPVTVTVPATASVKYPADWNLPDRKISPGAIQPGATIKDICPHVSPALEALRPSSAEKAKVYAAYGITSHPAGKYEIDHIIPIELLGQAGASQADPELNLYPEINDVPDPAMIAKYRLNRAFVHNSKDLLEDVLHAKVCSGQVPLATAQKAIAADWRKAYVMYVGPPPLRLPCSPAHGPGCQARGAA